MNRTAIAVLAAVALAGAAEFRAWLGDATLKDADRTYPRVSIRPANGNS